MGEFSGAAGGENKKPCPKIEAALEKSWLRMEKHPGCWQKKEGTACAQFDTCTGWLYIRGCCCSGTYRVPEGVMENDDAQALLGWLDAWLEEWL